LIADGNFPMETKTPQAKHIFLGLSAGIPDAMDVLNALLGIIRVEAAEVMNPDDGIPAKIFSAFSKKLEGLVLTPRPRQDFYAACQNPKVKLVIGTGEKRLFANLLLTIGVA
jgi:L-fucose mutarotase